MLRYYFDEDIKAPIAEQLQARGIDVLTAQKAGRAGKKILDPDQLAFATSLGRVIVTEDSNFIPLAYSQLSHAGVIRLQANLTIGKAIEELEVAAKVMEPEEMLNQLLYLP